MSQVSVGEDLISTLCMVGLVLIFIFVLGNSLSSFYASRDSVRDFRVLLRFNDWIRNGSAFRSDEDFPGLLDDHHRKRGFSIFMDRTRRATEITGMKITDLEGSVVCSHGRNERESKRAMMLPISYISENSSKPGKVVFFMEDD